MNKKDWLSIPNILSMIRILLIPVFAWSYLTAGDDRDYLFAAIVVVVSGVTDFLDGTIARKFGMITELGKFLDPLADKFLVLGALLALLKKYSAELGDLLVWVTLVVILRELAVTSLRLVAVNKSGKVIAASIWGKLKTVSQMVAIICVFLEPVIITPYIHTPAYLLSYITLVFMMVTTIFSGVDYFVKFLKD